MFFQALFLPLFSKLRTESGHSIIALRVVYYTVSEQGIILEAKPNGATLLAM
jgi:hypothetical protein